MQKACRLTVGESIELRPRDPGRRRRDAGAPSFDPPTRFGASRVHIRSHESVAVGVSCGAEDAVTRSSLVCGAGCRHHDLVVMLRPASTKGLPGTGVASARAARCPLRLYAPWPGYWSARHQTFVGHRISPTSRLRGPGRTAGLRDTFSPSGRLSVWSVLLRPDRGYGRHTAFWVVRLAAAAHAPFLMFIATSVSNSPMGLWPR